MAVTTHARPAPDPAAYARSFDARVAEVLPDAARASPGLRRRCEAAGLAPDDLTDAAALERLPVMSKDELLEAQRADPPFGGLLADGARPRRVFQSPGPLYEPEPAVPDHWRWAPALEAAGFGAGDVVLDAFGYHLSPAGAMFEQAAVALGCTVVPAGVGNAELQLQACADLGVTGYIGLPSYLKSLLEKAEDGGPAWAPERAFVTAEPLPPSLRAWLDERVGTLRQGYGTAEAGNLGYEVDGVEGLLVPDDALVQICRLGDGAPIVDGAEGQVVVTVLSPEYPLVRFGTGDVSAWAVDGAGAALPRPRIRGWLGRVGDAVKVRGMFLHPRQIEEAMAGLDGLGDWRFVVERVDHRDELRCEVVPAGADADALAESVRARVRDRLRFGVEVVSVPTLEGPGPLDDRRDWSE